ncbi:hypothetical protein Leryth_024097 [Lithospermum erythrorhizon]|nr:hypothetical protein Leryth_024097 [Lithospermum erythrorhizon]
MEHNKVCMNGLCRASITPDVCQKGWPLRYGEFAILCSKCGSAYEQLIFCETFHAKDSGWRECTSCGKRLHCGCIASSPFLELLSTGGVNCINCAKTAESISAFGDVQPKGCGLVATSSSGKKSNNQAQTKEPSPIPEEVGSMLVQRCSQVSGEPPQCSKMESIRMEDVNQALVQTNLSMALLSTPVTLQSGLIEREERQTVSPFLQGSNPRNLLPKPPKYIVSPGFETGNDTIQQLRVARPPVEGRIKNQLLPRYWPRITDEELQRISGDSNSTIVPLFEKVLSASDAGRIGRLVLPKACAEAYFPPISQPEGLPLRIQDVQGKEWVFQFRFWPNNNSRMYVLEGVTPCIQSMQLQAGDTVTFSRMDPGEKLLMGFRKASATVLMQDSHLRQTPKGNHLSEPFFPYISGSQSKISGYSGLSEPMKACGSSSFTKQGNGNGINGNVNDTLMNKAGDLILLQEHKRSRNIGSKRKRLAIDSQDAFELQLSWEEMQDMLRPPASIEPSIVMIEDYEFEEYEEPPVFAKRSIFTTGLSGLQEQWAQCDSCLKWRRLPVDFLLPAKWTCQENIGDHSRRSCSSPDELTSMELENLLKMNEELKKMRTSSHKADLAIESPCVSALGAAAAGCDIMSDTAATSVATTTKHPRHRPGCSCIVCIQPPSGKGKHKPTCTCNVCMTVKRRFKTLMMRKKKKQTEREAEIAQRRQFMLSRQEEIEVDSISRQGASHSEPLADKKSESELQLGCQSNHPTQESAEIENEQLDLNFQPVREELHAKSSRISMMSLLDEATLPLEKYLKQNGLASLACEQQGSSGSQVLPPVTVEHTIQIPEDHNLPGGAYEQEGDGELSEPDLLENELS